MGECRRPGIRDHPRGCGEHVIPQGSRRYPTGSSPRMRGAPPQLVPATFLLGIIPADAGSTDESSLTIPWSADHPRGCGEHDVVTEENKDIDGSSPRMRGARSQR